MTKYRAEKILGLSGSYDFQAYSKAYKRLLKANHPDIGGSVELTMLINEAKDYLKYYFEADKAAVITCAPSESAQAQATYEAQEAYEEAAPQNYASSQDSYEAYEAQAVYEEEAPSAKPKAQPKAKPQTKQTRSRPALWWRLLDFLGHKFPYRILFWLFALPYFSKCVQHISDTEYLIKATVVDLLIFANIFVPILWPVKALFAQLARLTKRFAAPNGH